MKRSSSAFTLLELLAVMVLVSILAALAGMFFSALLKSQRQALLRDRQRTEYARLDGILRNDAHAAAAVNVKSPTECELTDGQRRWTYVAEKEGLVRERFEGERRRQREVFHLRPGMQVKFTVSEQSGRSLLQLDLDLPAEPSSVKVAQMPYRAQLLVGGGVSTQQRVQEEQP